GRIQRFTADGKPLFAFGNNSTDPGGFGGRPQKLPRPPGGWVGRYGRILGTPPDKTPPPFSPGGETPFGFQNLEPGTEPKRFHTPHGMVIDSKGHLYVVDSQNYRIQKFAVPGLEDR